MTLERETAVTGRDALVADAVRRAESGRGTLVVGPPGHGKSRLLAEVSASLGRLRMPSAHLLASASAATVPFGAFLTLLDAATTERVGRADALGRAAIVRSSVQRLGLRAIVVDEAGLLDPASAAFLLDLAISGTAVVASITSGRRVPDAIKTLGSSGSAETVPLPPLTVAETAELVQSLVTGPVDSAALRELGRASAGNPSALRELLRDAIARGALARSGELWRLTGPLPAPRSVQQALEDRLRTADESLRRWLAVVAVADRVPMALAEHLVDDEVADGAERAGWTTYDPEQRVYRLRRPTHRTAIAASLGARARQSVLRDLVAAAETSDGNPDDGLRLALGSWRLELGQPLSVAEAIGLAAATTLSDPDLSERFLREALAQGAGTPGTIALAEHLKRTGRSDEAERLLAAVDDRAEDAAAAGHIALMMAIVSGIGSRRSRQALDVLDGYLATHAAVPDLLAVRIALLMRERRIAEAFALTGRVAHPRAAGFAPVFAGIHEVLLLAALGRDAEATAVIAELRGPAAQSLARIPEGPETMDWLSGWVPAVVALDIAAAAEVAERQYDRMVELGMHAARTQFAHLLGLCRVLQGDPGAAVQLLREAESSPGIWRDSWLPTIVAGQVEALVLTGDLAAAEAALTGLLAMAATPLHATAIELATAHVAAGRGDTAAAIATARATAARCAREGAVVEAFDALYAALRHGDASAAEALLAHGPVPAGRVRDLQRDHARAVVAGAGLDAVAAGFWAAGARLFAIGAAVSAAQQHADDEGTERAAAAERLTMWSLQTPTLAMPAMQRPTGSSLTRREREVVRLAAAGLPDRAIAEALGISVRTAQTHLGRAFGKLGVHRRSQLRVLLDAS